MRKTKLKVVKFVPEVADLDIVAELETLLELAKSGVLRSICYYATKRYPQDGQEATLAQRLGVVDRVKELGQAQLLVARIQNELTGISE